MRYADKEGTPRRVGLYLGGILPKGSIDAIWRCDLMERPVERLDTSDEWGAALVDLKIEPFAVETLLIELKKGLKIQ
jgi:hypothetical protein